MADYRNFLRFTRPELNDGLVRMVRSFESESNIKRFISNPIGSISQNFSEITGKISIDEISEANRLVFSIMGNDKFRNWATNYSNKIRQDFNLAGAGKIDQTKLRMDVAKAILEYGDQNIVYSLLGKQIRSEGLTTEDMQAKIYSPVAVAVVAVAVAVAVAVVVVAAVEVVPHSPPEEPNLALLAKDAGPNIRSISEQFVKFAKEFNAAELA